MSTLFTICSLLKNSAEITRKIFPEADLDAFIHEMNYALNSPAGIKLRVDSVKENLNAIMDKLSPDEKQTFQDNITQSFSSAGVSSPFDENGNLSVHFSDFLSQSEYLSATDVGDLSESVSEVSDSVCDTIDGTTDIVDNAGSIWDSIGEFLSDLF